MTNDAFVLAGGGVAGIAWETGVLRGLQETRPDLVASLLSPSTTLIGTSAGSTVAAQLALGIPLPDLYAAQLSDDTAELFVHVDLEALFESFTEQVAGATTSVEQRRRLGALALAAETPSTAARMAVIAARIPTAEWPTWPLVIPAVDAATGEPRFFDRDSGVSLVDAVAASCAVPGVWPTVEIDGRRYLDGGVRSGTNADLAAGADRVLILVPSPEKAAPGESIPAPELAALEPARVRTVFADEASVLAMVANPLDPATRRPTAQAGHALGVSLADELAAFWA